MKLPIDTGSITFLCAVAPEQVVDFETKVPKADENGEPLFTVQLVALGEGSVQILPVKVAGKLAGSITQGAAVKVSGLVATPWTMGDRSGVSFRAAKVDVVGASSAQAKQ